MKNNKDKTTINLIGPLELNTDSVNLELYTIVIDGGKNHHLNFLNTLSLGDNDSTNLKLDIELPKEKDYSDFAKALCYISAKTSTINCHGLFGGRLDHQLAIIGESCNFLGQKTAEFNFYYDNEIKLKIFSAGKWTFDFRGPFSVQSLYQQKIKITGSVDYSLLEYTNINRFSSHTISNSANGQFCVYCEMPLIIYFGQ